MSIIAEKSSRTAAHDPILQEAFRLYEQIRSHIADEDRKKHLLIDLNSGDWVVGHDDIALEDELLARNPDARMLLMRADGGPSGQVSWF